MLCGVVAVGGRIVLGGGGLRWEGEAPAEQADAIGLCGISTRWETIAAE